VDITAQEIKKAIDNHEKFVLLDVRTPVEFSRGKIQNAINIPVDEIQNLVTTMLPDKDTTVYVYCLSASRSFVAVEIMESMGYKHVYNMEHGLMAWRIYKYPLV